MMDNEYENGYDVPNGGNEENAAPEIRETGELLTDIGEAEQNGFANAPGQPTPEPKAFNRTEATQPEYFNNISRPSTDGGEYSYYPGNYSMTGRNGGGNVSYAPVQQTVPEKKKKEKKRKGHAGGIAVLLIVCILFSFGAGFAGSYLEKRLMDDGKRVSDQTEKGEKRKVTYNVVEPGEKPDAEDKPDGYYSSVIDQVRDSVVEISTEFKTLGYFQYIASGAGSGVIISDDGYIVTNNHVICKDDNMTVAESISVRTRDGKDYDAEVIGTDAQADVAVIKIEAEGLTAAKFGDSDTLEVGDEVIAIGNPLGELGGTVTNGIISALAREVEVEGMKMNLLQTNAAINPGNSGGGLFNMNGELIGLVNAKSGGSNVEGLGFAIPANEVRETAKELTEKGYVGKTIIGVTIYDALTAYDAQRLGVNVLGVYITEVVEGYNDDVLKRLDRVAEADGVEIGSGNDLINAVRSNSPGDTLTLTIYRDGRRMDVEVKCFESGGNN